MMRSARELMDLSVMLATDLQTYAREHDLSSKDMIQAAVIVERLVSRTYPGDQESLRLAVFEALATFEAMTTAPEMNQGN